MQSLHSNSSLEALHLNRAVPDGITFDLVCWFAHGYFLYIICWQLIINNNDCFQQFKLIELLGSNPISKLGLLTSAVDVVEVYCL